MKKTFLVFLCLATGFVIFAGNIRSKIDSLEAQLRNNPKDTSLLMELGRLYHNLAADGDSHAVSKAEEIFEKLLKIEPDNTEALAWHGSILTLKGYYEWVPVMKLVYVYNGIRKMRRAVELDPNNPAVRLIRANTSLALPRFFGQLKVAIQDFEYLLMLYEKAPNKFSEDMLADVYLGLGKAYKKAGDRERAKRCWLKVVELAPGSIKAEEAEELLQSFPNQ